MFFYSITLRRKLQALVGEDGFKPEVWEKKYNIETEAITTSGIKDGTVPHPPKSPAT